LVSTVDPSPEPLDADLSLLRSVSWGEEGLFTEPGTFSLGMASLRKLGLIERCGGKWVTTDDGESLLDDDF